MKFAKKAIIVAVIIVVFLLGLQIGAFVGRDTAVKQLLGTCEKTIKDVFKVDLKLGY